MKEIPNSSRKSAGNSKGVVAIYVAIIIVVFIGFAALAIDVGYMMVVRNQLQNASDAAALSACNHFYPRTPVITWPPPPPDWDAASIEANNAIQLNKADTKQLNVANVETGYWDITQPSLGLRPNTITPATTDGPAVRVTVQKTGGTNNGPITNFFASIFGIPTHDSGATSTAVAASPGSIRPEAVAPVAIAKEVADLYGGTNTTINIGSPYMYPNSLAGQWSSFMTDNNDTTTMRQLISGNPTALSIGDSIWIEPGVKDTLYANVNQPSINNTYAGHDVFFPIIDAILLDTTHTSQPIAGFIGFHIDSATGGSAKIITGHFITGPYYSGPIGPHYGPLDRCRLCE